MIKLLLIALMAMGTLYVQAQTKRTNTVGIGVNIFTYKNNYNSQTQANQKSINQEYSLSFGHFFADNQKLSLSLQHQRQSYNGSERIKGYGLGLGYQKYYPIFKSFYAFAGGKGSYLYSKGTENSGEAVLKSDNYSATAFGGLSWFVSKRIALEADLLSVGATYGTSKITGSGLNSTSKLTAFNLSTAGSAGNFGFRVHILF